MSLENTNILAAPSGGMDDLDSNFLGGVVFNFGSQYDTSSHSQTPSTDESAHQMSDPEDLATPFPTTPTVSSANKAPSKGTVPVSIRIRPLLSRDYAANPNCKPTVVAESATTLRLQPPPNAPMTTDASLSFTNVFSPESSQEEVFTRTAIPVLDRFLAGESGLLVAYGVTCSGKTHTVIGGEGVERGLLPRALEYIFDKIPMDQSYLSLNNDTNTETQANFAAKTRNQTQSREKVLNNATLMRKTPGRAKSRPRTSGKTQNMEKQDKLTSDTAIMEVTNLRLVTKDSESDLAIPDADDADTLVLSRTDHESMPNMRDEHSNGGLIHDESDRVPAESSGSDDVDHDRLSSVVAQYDDNNDEIDVGAGVATEEAQPLREDTSHQYTNTNQAVFASVSGGDEASIETEYSDSMPVSDDGQTSSLDTKTHVNVENRTVSRGYKLYMSCLEIYGNRVQDLLYGLTAGELGNAVKVLPPNPSGNSSNPVSGNFPENGGVCDISVITSAQGCRVQLKGCSSVWATTSTSAQACVNLALARRTTKSTRQNTASSRSHFIAQVELHDANGVFAKLNVVDLAGAEKSDVVAAQGWSSSDNSSSGNSRNSEESDPSESNYTASEPSGSDRTPRSNSLGSNNSLPSSQAPGFATLKKTPKKSGKNPGPSSVNDVANIQETNDINKSLLTLAACFQALAQKKAPPIRNSKLTSVLGEVLWDARNLALVCNVNPVPAVFPETQNTLKYADVTGKIKRRFVTGAQSTYAHLRTPGKTPRLAPTTPVRDSATVVALQEEIAELKSLLAEAGNNVTRAETARDSALQQLCTLSNAQADTVKAAVKTCISDRVHALQAQEVKHRRDVEALIVNFFRIIGGDIQKLANTLECVNENLHVTSVDADHHRESGIPHISEYLPLDYSRLCSLLSQTANDSHSTDNSSLLPTAKTQPNPLCPQTQHILSAFMKRLTDSSCFAPSSNASLSHDALPSSIPDNINPIVSNQKSSVSSPSTPTLLLLLHQALEETIKSEADARLLDLHAHNATIEVEKEALVQKLRQQDLELLALRQRLHAMDSWKPLQALSEFSLKDIHLFTNDESEAQNTCFDSNRSPSLENPLKTTVTADSASTCSNLPLNTQVSGEASALITYAQPQPPVYIASSPNMPSHTPSSFAYTMRSSTSATTTTNFPVVQVKSVDSDPVCAYVLHLHKLYEQADRERCRAVADAVLLRSMLSRGAKIHSVHLRANEGDNTGQDAISTSVLPSLTRDMNASSCTTNKGLHSLSSSDIPTSSHLSGLSNCRCGATTCRACITRKRALGVVLHGVHRHSYRHHMPAEQSISNTDPFAFAMLHGRQEWMMTSSSTSSSTSGCTSSSSSADRDSVLSVSLERTMLSSSPLKRKRTSAVPHADIESCGIDVTQAVNDDVSRSNLGLSLSVENNEHASCDPSPLSTSPARKRRSVGGFFPKPVSVSQLRSTLNPITLHGQSMGAYHQNSLRRSTEDGAPNSASTQESTTIINFDVEVPSVSSHAVDDVDDVNSDEEAELLLRSILGANDDHCDQVQEVTSPSADEPSSPHDQAMSLKTARTPWRRVSDEANVRNMRSSGEAVTNVHAAVHRGKPKYNSLESKKRNR